MNLLAEKAYENSKTGVFAYSDVLVWLGGTRNSVRCRSLDEYACLDAEEELNAMREILQDLILAGLARTDFFTKAAFHGGTQLRIFEGIRRFSEIVNRVTARTTTLAE